jgi:drug/metabolite transporter (DMT)-like permease
LLQRLDPAVQAILLVCLGGVLFVVMNAMVKALTVRFDPILLIWARYFFHVVLILALFPRSWPGFLRTTQLGVQLGRSVLLLASTVLNFLALVYLPLGEVAAITFTSPILVAALAVVMLRERVGVERWVAIGLGFVGTLMVVRPEAGGLNLGAVLALGCAMAYALYQISTRIVREAEPFASLLYGGLVGMVLFSALVPFAWTWPTPLEWLLLILIGVLGALGHLCVIAALRRAEASRVSPFTYVQLVWAMLLGLVAFGDRPPPLTLLGALVIVASGLYVYRLDRAERAARAAGLPRGS